jgi:hypothetical protein
MMDRAGSRQALTHEFSSSSSPTQLNQMQMSRSVRVVDDFPDFFPPKI